MTSNITALTDNRQQIDLDYADEGIELQGSTTIIGDTARAASYVEVFDRDLRKTYSHLFPQPEPSVDEDYGM